MPRIGSAYRIRRPSRGPGLRRLLLYVAALIAAWLMVERYAAGQAVAGTERSPSGRTGVAESGADDSSLEVVAPPGSIVRWRGEGLAECRLEGEAFPPLADSCLFPVDLLRAGELRAERRTADGSSHELRILIGDYPYSVQHITLQDTSRVKLSEENQRRAAREATQIRQLWSRRGERQYSLPLGPPLQQLGEARRFGSRRVFNGEPRSPHTGADFSADRGTPVLAVASGTVSLAEEHFFAGNSVFLDHGDGLISMYFHLDEIRVAAGEKVSRGAMIGKVGSTGRATGPHLHFGLRWRGARVDPSLLLGPVESLPRVE